MFVCLCAGLLFYCVFALQCVAVCCSALQCVAVFVRWSLVSLCVRLFVQLFLVFVLVSLFHCAFECWIFFKAYLRGHKKRRRMEENLFMENLNFKHGYAVDTRCTTLWPAMLLMLLQYYSHCNTHCNPSCNTSCNT